MPTAIWSDWSPKFSGLSNVQGHQACVQQVQSVLSAAYGRQQVSTIFGPANEYWVMMQLAPQYQTDIRALDALYVQPLLATAVSNPVAIGRPKTLRAVMDHNLDWFNHYIWSEPFVDEVD